MGLEEPMRVDDKRWWLGMHPDVWMAAYAHVTVSFNALVISLVIKIAEDEYPITDTEDTLVTTSFVAGAIVGMLFFGWLADATTRKGALLACMLLAFVGASGCALVYPTNNLYIKLTAWRFVEGIGAGGIYPLVATIARESPGATPRTVATTICAQGIGYFLAPVAAYALLATVDIKAAVWRSLLAIGAGLLLTALPVIVLQGRSAGGGELSLAPRRNSSHDYSAPPPESAALPPATDSLATVLRLPQYRWLLAGTAGCWFLFDTVFYANTLFEDVVLDVMFPNADSDLDTSMQYIVTYAVALPGYFLAFLLMDKLGPRYMQAQGFLVVATLFAVLGSLYTVLGQDSPSALLLIYAMTFFFNNFGPNCTTFVIPSLTFPAEHRAALNGASAAAGKAGALLGSLTFEPLSSAIGVGGVFVCCAAIAATAAVLTVVFVQPDLGLDVLDQAIGGGGGGSDGGSDGGSGSGGGGRGLALAGVASARDARGSDSGGEGDIGGGPAVAASGTSLSASELLFPILKGDALAGSLTPPAHKSGWRGRW